MGYEPPRTRAAVEKCQDVAVWGTVVLLVLGFITSMFLAPGYAFHDNGVGGTYAEQVFNWQLFSIFLIGIVLVIGVGIAAMRIAYALEQMQSEQREAWRAAARSTTAP